MSEPFISEIRIFGFNFAPKGWAFCNGQTLPINQNQALFSLLGTTYGGDGVTTFQLPNFQGRVPMHTGTGFTLGQTGGEQTHTLITNEMPGHTHVPQGSTDSGTTVIPTGSVLAAASGLYGSATDLVSLSPQTLGVQGSGQPHDNMQPYLTLNFCIALVGIFPSRN